MDLTPKEQTKKERKIVQISAYGKDSERSGVFVLCNGDSVWEFFQGGWIRMVPIPQYESTAPKPKE